MPQRNLIYTGVDRGRKLVVLTGSAMRSPPRCSPRVGRRQTAFGGRLRSAASLPAGVINGPFHTFVLICIRENAASQPVAR